MAEAYALNVADHEQSSALLHKLQNDGGRVDVLINNGAWGMLCTGSYPPIRGLH